MKYSLVCVFRKRAACKSSTSSHKYKSSSKDLKPPDLWIHHERLELKPMDKSPDPNTVMTETPIPRTAQDPAAEPSHQRRGESRAPASSRQHLTQHPRPSLFHKRLSACVQVTRGRRACPL